MSLTVFLDCLCLSVGTVLILVLFSGRTTLKPFKKFHPLCCLKIKFLNFNILRQITWQKWASIALSNNNNLHIACVKAYKESIQKQRILQRTASIMIITISRYLYVFTIKKLHKKTPLNGVSFYLAKTTTFN